MVVYVLRQRNHSGFFGCSVVHPDDGMPKILGALNARRVARAVITDYRTVTIHPLIRGNVTAASGPNTDSGDYLGNVTRDLYERLPNAPASSRHPPGERF